MIAEDLNGGNLTEMMNSDRFSELQAFHDHIYSYYFLAEFGIQQFTDANLRERRRNYYVSSLIRALIITIAKSCNSHFCYKLWYEYDSETNTIQGRENISYRFTENDCLCYNYQERLILSEPFVPPSLQRPETTVQIFINDSEVSLLDVQQYHVIPLPLISRFFQIWLSGDSLDFPENQFTGCLRVLIGRLRRSMQKLLIVQMRNSQAFSDEEWYTIRSNLESSNANFFTELFRRRNSWLRGNIFLGPRNRGPFSPEFEMPAALTLTAFEIDR